MTRRRGASAIEFALLLPALLLLAAGVAEWGRYLQERQLVDLAVREGARAASVTPFDASPTPTDVAVSRTREALLSYGLPATDATVHVDWSDLVAGTTCDTVDTVTVTASFPFTAWFVDLGMPAAVEGTMTMMAEHADCT